MTDNEGVSTALGTAFSVLKIAALHAVTNYADTHPHFAKLKISKRILILLPYTLLTVGVR